MYHLLHYDDNKTSCTVDVIFRRLAYQALQGTLTNFVETRDIILSSFVAFIQTDIPDTYPQLADNALRMMQMLLCHWRTQISSGAASAPKVRPVALTLYERTTPNSEPGPKRCS